MDGLRLRGRGGCVALTVSLISRFVVSELMRTVNHDDYISRWRNTNYTREEALSQIL